MNLPGESKRLIFPMVYQPKTWKERFNLVNGSAFEPSYNFWQVGCLRLHIVTTNIKPIFGRRIHTPRHRPAHCLAFCSLTIEQILKKMGTISVQNLKNAVLASTD